MNKEKLRQVTIAALKETVENEERWFKEGFITEEQRDYAGLRIDGFECFKMKNGDIHCRLTFKDSHKTYESTITRSVSYWDEVN